MDTLRERIKIAFALALGLVAAIAAHSAVTAGQAGSPAGSDRPPADFDRDDISDELESQLLSMFAPELRAGDFGAPVILPIDWYVRHCRLCWYGCIEHPTLPGVYFYSQVDCTSDATSMDEALGIMETHQQTGLVYDYRLSFIDGAYQFGNDPDDPMNWEIAEREGRGMYGRVAPFVHAEPSNCGDQPQATGDLVRVQYFAIFGWNETDTPPTCDAGNHEGDVICVDFNVSIADPENPRITRAIFHNHGRQVFVPADQLTYSDGTHPIVFLERGANEPWAWSSPVGMTAETVPPDVTANKIFPPQEYFGFLVGGEYGDWTAVREHEGLGPSYLVTSVVNLGERGFPGSNPESLFLHDYYGMLGDWWSNGCTICVPWPLCFDIDFLNTESPRAPMHNGAVHIATGSACESVVVEFGCSKMWDRAFDEAVLRVDATAPPGGDGMSWDTAYNSLQGALNGCVEDFRFRDVWVAEGTYTPAPPGGDRASTFRLQSGRRVYGGFAGSETELEQRNPSVNLSILSGDLNGDDGPGFTNYADNSRHVVTASGTSASALLDGFTIQGGYADTSQNPDGINYNGGAGIRIAPGSPRIRNCTIAQNKMTSPPGGGGGGIFCYQLSNPTFARCKIVGNTSDGPGGGVYMHNDSNVTHSAPVFIDCEFLENEGGGGACGGGAACNHRADARYIRCTFRSNVGTISAGGAVSNAASESSFINCLFLDNAIEAAGGTGNGGGAVWNGGDGTGNYGQVRLTNCVLARNHANFNSGQGGAIYSVGALDVRNCTIYGNTAFQSNTGGIWVQSNSFESVVTNSIVYGNSGLHEIWGQQGGAGISVSYSNVQGEWLGEGVIDVNPLYVDVSTGDFHLLPDSPCINQGANALLSSDQVDLDGDGDIVEPIPVDLDESPRIQGGAVDMGAYEFQPDSNTLCPADIVTSATFQPPPDGGVDGADLAFLLGEWGRNAGSPADFVTGATFQPPPDGFVDGADLAVLLGAWGPCD